MSAREMPRCPPLVLVTVILAAGAATGEEPARPDRLPPRPGHADAAYDAKYGFRDPRGGGRASARETAMRVAAGAVAKKWLREQFGTQIRGCMTALGEINIPVNDWAQTSVNPFFAADATVVPKLEQYMIDLRAAQDSVGARLLVEAHHVPVGLGAPLFDKLDADIAYAMMGVNAVKGVEIGDGFEVVKLRGSQNRDEITKEGFQSNHAGGILGGISSGQQIVANMALKPTSSITVPA